MALTRLAAFPTGSVLTSSQLTSEFDNIYNNALTLISPLTANLDVNNKSLLNLARGSAAAPSLYFNADSGTGVYSAAANQVGWSVAGAAVSNFTTAAAGPHVIGSGTTNTRYALLLTGTITLSGATQEAGFASDQTLTNASGVNLYGSYHTQTLTNVAGATTTMAWVAIAPSALTITAGSVTNAAGLYISAAPSGATNNYALWVAGGNVLLAANLQASSVGIGVAASGTAGRLTVNENLIVSGTGPHAIGGATSADFQALLTGAFTGSANAHGLRITSSLTAAAGGDIVGSSIAPTLIEAASGVHGIEAGLRVLLTITNGAATATDAAGIYIDGFTAAAGTTNASGLKIAAAPTGGTNNYALWVAGGTVRWDNGIANGAGAAVTLGNVGGAGPATAGQNQWLRVNIGGTVNFIPVWQ